MITTLRVALVGAVLMSTTLCAVAQQPMISMNIGGGGPAMLISSKTVLKEIKATDEQGQQLKILNEKLSNEQREQMNELRQELQANDPREMMQKMQAMQTKMADDAYKAMNKILDDKQVERLKQIEIQVATTRAFKMDKVLKAINFSDEQKEEISSIEKLMSNELRELIQDLGITPGLVTDPKIMQELQKKSSMIQRETSAKIIALFTEKQKSAWKELVGEKVDVAKIQEETRISFKKRDD